MAFLRQIYKVRHFQLSFVYIYTPGQISVFVNLLKKCCFQVSPNKLLLSPIVEAGGLRNVRLSVHPLQFQKAITFT